MCDEHKLKLTAKTRPGSALAHGEAHEADHSMWSRRHFLSTMGAASVGGSMMLAGRPVQAFARTPWLDAVAAANTDRILVLIQLEGGNDGLNTIVPVTNDLYYSARPSLAIPANQTLPLTGELGWHPSLAGFRDIFDDGEMAVLQNVGYDAPDLSHFRSTDIWTTSSDSDESLTTGWAGRYLSTVHPDVVTNPPVDPLAVQIGGPSLVFQGPEVNMGMAIRDLDRFNEFAETGRFYTLDSLPSTAYGDEMWFLRNVVNSAFRYGEAIRAAANAGTNDVNYDDHHLAESLSIAAKLIKGDLETRIYMVSLNGFDTHANQADDHAALLSALSSAVTSFMADLPESVRDRVIIATFSEFGRRINQNGSDGTDHGTSAPLFVIGKNVNGGLYGPAPDLSQRDAEDNLIYDIDFRHAYATILRDWFGADDVTTDAALTGSFDSLGFLSTSTAVNEAADGPQFGLEQNYPNPFAGRTRIKYALDDQAYVRLEVFDVRGRLVATLVDEQRHAGEHEVAWVPDRLPSGPYFCRLSAGDRTRTVSMMHLR